MRPTNHAAWVESFIKSDEFRNGAYRNKTIIVHSKQKGSETEAKRINTLLSGLNSIVSSIAESPLRTYEPQRLPSCL